MSEISEEFGLAIDRALNVLFGYGHGGLPAPPRTLCAEIHDELDKIYQKEVHDWPPEDDPKPTEGE